VNAIDFQQTFDSEEAAQTWADTLSEPVVIIHVGGKFALVNRGAVFMIANAVGLFVLKDEEEA